MHTNKFSLKIAYAIQVEKEGGGADDTGGTISIVFLCKHTLHKLSPRRKPANTAIQGAQSLKTGTSNILQILHLVSKSAVQLQL